MTNGRNKFAAAACYRTALFRPHRKDLILGWLALAVCFLVFSFLARKFCRVFGQMNRAHGGNESEYVNFVANDVFVCRAALECIANTAHGECGEMYGEKRER